MKLEISKHTTYKFTGFTKQYNRNLISMFSYYQKVEYFLPSFNNSLIILER